MSVYIEQKVKVKQCAFLKAQQYLSITVLYITLFYSYMAKSEQLIMCNGHKPIQSGGCTLTPLFCRFYGIFFFCVQLYGFLFVFVDYLRVFNVVKSPECFIPPWPIRVVLLNWYLQYASCLLLYSFVSIQFRIFFREESKKNLDLFCSKKITAFYNIQKQFISFIYSLDRWLVG